MSKTRATVKYVALGSVVVAYAGGLSQVLKQDPSEARAVTPTQAAIAGGTLLVLTLVAGLL